MEPSKSFGGSVTEKIMKIKMLTDFAEYREDCIFDLPEQQAVDFIKRGLARAASWREVAREALAMPKFLKKIIKK